MVGERDCSDQPISRHDERPAQLLGQASQMNCAEYVLDASARTPRPAPLVPALGAIVVLALVAVLTGCAPATDPPTPIVLIQNGDDRLRQPDIAPELPMSYIVNFRPSHALGRARSLQNAGRYDDAEMLVAVTLRDDASLRGLCL